VVNQSVTSALAAEALVAPVKRIVVDATQALAAAVAEFRRPFSATVACRHCLVERAETTGLDFLTSLRLQTLICAMLEVRITEVGRVVRRTWMSGFSRVGIHMMCARVMLGIGVRVALGLRLGFHVDSSRKNPRPVIVYF